MDLLGSYVANGQKPNFLDNLLTDFNVAGHGRLARQLWVSQGILFLFRHGDVSRIIWSNKLPQVEDNVGRLTVVVRLDKKQESGGGGGRR